MIGSFIINYEKSLLFSVLVFLILSFYYAIFTNRVSPN